MSFLKKILPWKSKTQVDPRLSAIDNEIESLLQQANAYARTVVKTNPNLNPEEFKTEDIRQKTDYVNLGKKILEKQQERLSLMNVMGASEDEIEDYMKYIQATKGAVQDSIDRAKEKYGITLGGKNKRKTRKHRSRKQKKTRKH